MTACIDKSQVRQHFSAHAEEYDRYALVQHKVAENLAALLPDVQGAGRLALEIGCGTGMLSRQVASRLPGLPLILTDLAHGMCLHTSQLYPASPICDADAAALPFRNHCFDLVMTSSVYQWLNDLPGAFGEVSRVLAPGGYFVLALFGEKTLYELRDSHQFALGQEESHGQNFPTLQQVSVAATDLFEVEQLSSEFETEWHASVRDLLRSLKRIGAQNASRERPQGFASRQVMQQMITYYQQHYGQEAGVPATYEVIYLLARRK